MTIENETLDKAKHIVDTKAIEAALSKKHDELLDVVKKATEEAKDAGTTSTETKAAVDAVSETLNEMSDRLQAIEQRGASIDLDSKPQDFGSDFTKSEQFKTLAQGSSTSARMEFKTAIINATGQNQPLVAADRLQGINAAPNRMLSIRDMIPTSATNSNLIEFVRENVFTDNAGPTIAGSPEAVENVTKPESGITFTLQTEAVRTLAHFIPASKQVLDDSMSLQSYINGRLTYGLKLKEETQLLSGTGINGELNGLITVATAYVNSSINSPQYNKELDILRDAIRQAHVSEYFPDAIVLHPTDFFSIEIAKVSATDDRYVIGNPRSLMAPTLWGLPVVVTNSIAAGTFLLGSFGLGAEIKDREQSSVEVSREDGNNFTKNMLTILAEERLALITYRTEAFITGSL